MVGRNRPVEARQRLRAPSGAAMRVATVKATLEACLWDYQHDASRFLVDVARLALEKLETVCPDEPETAATLGDSKSGRSTAFDSLGPAC